MFLIAFDSIFGSVRLARSPASADPADARPGAAPPPRRVWVEAVSLYLGRSQKGRGKLDFASIRSLGTGTLDQNQPEHLQITRNTKRNTSKPPETAQNTEGYLQNTFKALRDTGTGEHHRRQPTAAARCIRFEPRFGTIGPGRIHTSRSGLALFDDSCSPTLREASQMSRNLTSLGL